MLILIFFAFLAGIVTVLSPCILPVLPIVLSGSVGEGKRRPLGVVSGFIVSFTFFTLFLTLLVGQLGIAADSLRLFSIVIIGIFGAGLLIPQFQAWLEKLFTVLSRFAPSQQQDGFMGGFVLGLSLGLVWTPCVGPILASVISLALIGSVSGTAFLITLAYALGTGLPMLAITYGGRQLLMKTPWLTRNLQKIQQGFGAIMILIAVAMYFNLDRQFQTWVLEKFPNYGTGLTQIENVDSVKNELQKLSGSSQKEDMGQPLFEMQSEKNYPAAPQLTGGTAWLNSEPLQFGGNLQGKVVLVDFWTYTCINCIRTLPHLTSWYERYKDDGFVIVGVHAPEFEFEKNQNNVVQAMQQYGIEYPVVQDNDFKIWRAYNNRYWPAHYLVDKEGRIRYTHFGEGKYEETEAMIRQLLGEESLSETGSVMPDETPDRPQTSETYLGYARADAYTYDNSLSRDKVASYQFNTLPQDSVGLTGDWLVASEYIQAKSVDASLSINCLGQVVHLVLDPMGSTGQVEVLLDGQPLPAKYHTADMDENGIIQVDEARKYDLIDLGADYGRHTLQLKFSEGVAAYAFTFSS